MASPASNDEERLPTDNAVDDDDNDDDAFNLNSELGGAASPPSAIMAEGAAGSVGSAASSNNDNNRKASGDGGVLLPLAQEEVVASSPSSSTQQQQQQQQQKKNEGEEDWGEESAAVSSFCIGSFTTEPPLLLPPPAAASARDSRSASSSSINSRNDRRLVAASSASTSNKEKKKQMTLDNPDGGTSAVSTGTTKSAHTDKSSTKNKRTRASSSNSRASSPKPPSKTSKTAASVTSATNSVEAIIMNNGGSTNKKKKKPPAPPPPPLWTHREFPHPESLLEERSLKRARQEDLRQLASMSSSAGACVVPDQICGLLLPEKKFGVCGNCGTSNDDIVGNTILLCDGPGCGQEFHMQCCTPPLQRIPKGAFFCFDCCTLGSTKQLEEYFSEHEAAKDKFEALQLQQLLQQNKTSTKTNSKKKLSKSMVMTSITTVSTFAEALLEQDILDDLKQKNSADGADETIKIPSGTNSRPTTDQQDDDDAAVRLPCSELDTVPIDSFIGKPVRLYCPLGNSYHNGRILDIRQGEESPSGRHVIGLVRFPAGKDFRKKSVTRWMNLEEHCLAVATNIVWGLFGSGSKDKVTSSPKKQNKGGRKKSANPTWMPGKIWRRSAREVVPVLHLLDEKLNQIRYRNQSSQCAADEEHEQERSNATWGLIETFGTGTYDLLNLDLETKPENPFLSDINRPQKGEQLENASIKGLVKIEMEEQRRIRQWKALPLCNPMHPDALKSQDEAALGPLDFETHMEKQFLRPPDLVQQGVDRQMLLNLVSRHLNQRPSKDISLDMDCVMVDSLPSTIQSITHVDIRRCNQAS